MLICIAMLLLSCDEETLTADNGDQKDSLSNKDSIDAEIDTSHIYQTWHTEFGQGAQFAFTIHEDGYIEFLQWDLAAGSLVSPFSSGDRIYFDFDSMAYKMDLSSCHSRAYASYSQENGFYVGKIDKLTADSMVMDAFILDYSYFDGIKFVAIDRSDFKRDKIESTYSADIHIVQIGSDEDTSTTDYTFENPEISYRPGHHGSSMQNNTLKMRMYHYENPCVNGNSYFKIMELVIHDFEGKGIYESSSVHAEYMEMYSDIMVGFSIDSTVVEITEYNEGLEYVRGDFQLFGNQDQYAKLEIHGAFNLYLDEVQDW